MSLVAGLRSLTDIEAKRECIGYEITDLHDVAKKNKLPIRISEGGWGADKPVENMMSLIVGVAQEQSVRKIVVRVDMSSNATYEAGLKQLKSTFYVEASKMDKRFVPTLSEELRAS